jgi:hypothetical protein
MTFSRKRTVLLCATLAVVGALFSLEYYRAQVPKSGSPSDESAPTVEPPFRPKPATKNTVNETSAPSPKPLLPDLQLPLSSQLEDLIALAEAGDTRATCRLAISATRCKEQLRHQRLGRDFARELESGKSPNEAMLISLAAANEEDMELGKGFCAGVQMRDLPSPGDLVEQRLHSLSPSQKTVLALMQSNGELRRLNATRSFTESALYVLPQYQADYTQEFLNAGYAAREPLALEGLILLHAPGALLAPQSVGLWLPDPKRFLHYVFVMQAVYGESSVGEKVQRLAQAAAYSISASDLQQARSSASRDAQRWLSSMSHRSSAPSEPKASSLEVCD